VTLGYVRNIYVYIHHSGRIQAKQTSETDIQTDMSPHKRVMRQCLLEAGKLKM